MWIGSFKSDGKDVFFGTSSSGATTRLCGTKDEAAMALADLENDEGNDVAVAEVFALEVICCERQLKDDEDIVDGCIILKRLNPYGRVTYLVYLSTGFVFLEEAETLQKAIACAHDHWEP
ncbi:hypothetical protein [Rhizobium leguminosarum]|nr:hypothetical protein [Rhizobium leguminosarum]MBY5416069.1 hypothetical protein [Rhizobium leguminosarum]TBF40431.1 hypothetical protein ELG92_10335 [Rhizobium leguminosarum]TBF82587.1 hypothetical protein ELG86_10810 [Rhizobium leguminosarum]TBH02073.1 hypothetical protein ELG70_10785 [Rhizobium leguminosarum]TBH41731.1 hypothetical protein ELG63_10310 [Rhizobium leguminosarum]